MISALDACLEINPGFTKVASVNLNSVRAARCGLLALLMSFVHLVVAAETRPNIIVLLADDLGWGDVACYGGKMPTPNLDAMAREGTRFTQFYVASPIC